MLFIILAINHFKKNLNIPLLQYSSALIKSEKVKDHLYFQSAVPAVFLLPGCRLPQAALFKKHQPPTATKPLLNCCISGNWLTKTIAYLVETAFCPLP